MTCTPKGRFVFFESRELMDYGPGMGQHHLLSLSPTPEQTPLGRTVGEMVPSKDNPVSAEMGGRWRTVWEDGLEVLGIWEGIGC